MQDLLVSWHDTAWVGDDLRSGHGCNFQLTICSLAKAEPFEGARRCELDNGCGEGCSIRANRSRDRWRGS